MYRRAALRGRQGLQGSDVRIGSALALGCGGAKTRMTSGYRTEPERDVNLRAWDADGADLCLLGFRV
jgi:hypothetical protein